MSSKVSFTVAATRPIRSAGQLSLAALLAGLGAGCSGVFPIKEPIFTGSTTNQQQIISGQPASSSPAGYGQYAAAAPAGGVQGADLPPPTGAPAPAYAATPMPAPQPYTPPQSYAAAPAPQPAASTQLGAPPTTLNQQAASIDGGPKPAPATAGTGGVHVVQSGDTAWNISQRYGISVDQLVAANGGSSTVKLGQKIVIPGSSASAVAATPSTPQPVQVAAVDPQAMPTPAPAVATSPAPAVATAPVAPASDIIPPAPEAQQATLTPQAAEPPPAAADSAASSSGFRWPVRGRVISGFGKKPNGERNDGINLAVPEGTEVKAAEDGTIIYAGNELKSYGNLVLIRHADGWVSAYAHNSDLKVRRGQEVRRGETIAVSGMSGGVTTPQVHFELRKDATPVDPLQHLTES
jgi:murein DD-endopeptidase MepM/ murein hydrolase activator NlpD